MICNISFLCHHELVLNGEIFHYDGKFPFLKLIDQVMSYVEDIIQQRFARMVHMVLKL